MGKTTLGFSLLYIQSINREAKSGDKGIHVISGCLTEFPSVVKVITMSLTSLKSQTSYNSNWLRVTTERGCPEPVWGSCCLWNSSLSQSPRSQTTGARMQDTIALNKTTVQTTVNQDPWAVPLHLDLYHFGLSFHTHPDSVPVRAVTLLSHFPILTSAYTQYGPFRDWTVSPTNAYVEVLTPSTSECGYIWRYGLQRDN